MNADSPQLRILEPSFRKLLIAAERDLRDVYPEVYVEVTQTYISPFHMPKTAQTYDPKAKKTKREPLPVAPVVFDPINYIPSLGARIWLRTSRIGRIPFQERHPLWGAWRDWGHICRSLGLDAGSAWKRKRRPEIVQIGFVTFILMLRQFLRILGYKVDPDKRVFDDDMFMALRQYRKRVGLPSSKFEFRPGQAFLPIDPDLWAAIWLAVINEQMDLQELWGGGDY